MASITQSTIVADSAQKDGRRWVQERFTDSLGVTHDRHYLCEQAFDANAQLALDAVQCLADLVAAEISDNLSQVTTLGAQAAPKFTYSTVAQNVAALRAAYVLMTRTDAIFTGEYLNSLTDNQLQNAFGLAQGQVTTLRTNKLQPASDLAAQIRATTGA